MRRLQQNERCSVPDCCPTCYICCVRRYGLHKITGVFALYSFFYRYAVVWPSTGTLGFNGTYFDSFTMMMHMTLSASSIQFRVPSFRQPRRPTMIWNEYRLHAILFTARCCLVYALGAVAPDAGVAVRYGTTMAMHVVVDYVSSQYGKPGETTIRGRGATKKSFIEYMRRGYSFYQFLAVASHLSHSPRAMDMGYNTIIAIQSSAFLMTLNRKGLASWQTHFKIYSAALLASGIYIVSRIALDFSPWVAGVFVGLAAVAFLMRTRLGLSKYLIWALFASAFAYATDGPAALAPATAFSLG